VNDLTAKLTLPSRETAPGELAVLDSAAVLTELVGVTPSTPSFSSGFADITLIHITTYRGCRYVLRISV
jgi:hypothetical protein